MKKPTNHILKEAISLFIVALLIFSTVAVVANTEEKQLISIQGKNGTVYIEEPINHASNPRDGDILLTEGFEDGALPSGWQNIDYDGDTYMWNFIDSTGHPPHSGTYSAMSESYANPPGPGALTPDNWLITTAIDLTSYTSAELSYWVAAQDPDWAVEHLEVWVSTTGTIVPSDFVDQVDDYTCPAGSSDWFERIVDLSAYGGETIYLAFRHCDVTDMFQIKIDDVQVTGSGGGVEGYVIQFQNTSAEPGDVDHVVEITGTWEEEIFATYIRFDYGTSLAAGDITITNVTLEGSVMEEPYVFNWAVTDYGTSGFVSILIFFDAQPWNPGEGVSAGSGKLCNLVIDIASIAEEQVIGFTESDQTVNYYLSVGYEAAEFIPGYLTIAVANQPPETPDQPSGPSSGYVGIEYEFTTNEVTDPEGDDVFYLFDWGDGTDSGWVDEPSASHIWEEVGTFDIMVKAKDIYEAESDWSETTTVDIQESAVPDLNIKSIEGGFGLTIVVENTGDAVATNVELTVAIKGGLIILTPELTDTVATINASESAEFRFLVLGIGFGILKEAPTFTVAASCDEGVNTEETATGKILFVLVTLEE